MIKIFLLNRSELDRISIPDEMLSEDRRALLARIRPAAERERTRSAELALMAGLWKMAGQAKLPGQPYRDLRFPLSIARDDQGKPFLPDAPEICFNLSHSGDWAVACISDAPVGIDIEQIRERPVRLANRILHPEEFRLYSELPAGSEAQRYFYECWVAKESYLKQLGLGIRIRPDAFMVREGELVTEQEELTGRSVHIFRGDECPEIAVEYCMAVCSDQPDEDRTIEVLHAEQFEAIQ